MLDGEDSPEAALKSSSISISPKALLLSVNESAKAAERRVGSFVIVIFCGFTVGVSLLYLTSKYLQDPLQLQEITRDAPRVAALWRRWQGRIISLKPGQRRQQQGGEVGKCVFHGVVTFQIFASG